jgi:outer membrane protein OmpA-like peptidoglycan-associated protein
VSQYGIKESRLIGYGVGPYAPAANNKNDLGRQLNRRVELVERLSN